MAESSASLVRGANTAIASAQVNITIDWAAGVSAAVYACPTAADGKMRSGKDSLSAGRTGGSGPIRASFGSSPKAAFALDLAKVAAEVAKIQFCIAVATGTRAALGKLVLSVSTPAGSIAHFDLPDDLRDDAALVMAELYRRGGDWKLRAVGQGFKDGLDRLAEFLGCDPADLRDAAKARAEPASPAAPRPAVSSSAPITSSNPAPAPRGVVRAASSVSAPPSADLFSCRGWALSEEGVDSSGPLARGVSLHDRELLDLRRDGQGKLWPAAFLYQPWTGEELPAKPQLDITSGRGVAPGGLPHLESVKALDIASRQEESVPEGARLFASGGMPPRLVAVDPVDCRAWWHAPMSKQWIPLGRCPSSSLPSYANGAVGTPDGVFYAADDGLVHILPEQKPTLKTHAVNGSPIAAPAAIEGIVAAPFRVDGGIILTVRLADGSLEQVSAGPSGQKAEDEVLGPPVVNSGVAFWIGRAGFLSFDADPQRATAKWHAWPAGTEGLAFLTPYRSANGRLWAMGRQVGPGGRAVVCAMAAGGSREVHDLLGPHVSVGPQTFRGRGRYQEPWGDATEEINIGLDYEGRWILPLLRLGNRETLVALVEQASDEGGMRAFLFREETGAKREIALALHGDNRALKLLGQTFRVGSTDDIELFLNDERLSVHHFESNQCTSWSVSFYR